MYVAEGTCNTAMTAAGNKPATSLILNHSINSATNFCVRPPFPKVALCTAVPSSLRWTEALFQWA